MQAYLATRTERLREYSSVYHSLLGFFFGLDQIRVASIDNGDTANTEVLTTSSSQLNVVAAVVVDTGL